MNIKSVDNKNNLFSVEDFFSEELLEELSGVDIRSVSWTKEMWQTEYERRRLTDHIILDKFDRYVKDHLKILNELTGMNAYHCDTGFWLDGPNFTMSNHLDNSDVYAAMQLYLLDLQNCPGTRFTDELGAERITFPYKQNTGYLMLNDIDQYHEVAGVVPDDTYRLCSYTWFYSNI